ncbi:unnamed protein product [Rotaria sp. Silwood2]|nr:unnamed protein product [Rotaria sp. Silwood2]
MAAGPSTSSNNPPILPMHDKTPLSHLLEAAVQKTYHELYTMADVLPSKTNLERKKELVKFACRTRQLFIRILAVVKWATTAGKVNACETIQHFLENRARLIRETSDCLAQLARIKLLDARLPNFPITDAIDALTLGSVHFLPDRLSEGTTPFIPASESERQEILPRLQQILTARLAIAELPIQITNVTIKNGIVTLAVHGEFEVKLGIKSDNLFASWHVYKTKLFLRDPEEPGMQKNNRSHLSILVHVSDVNQLLVQYYLLIVEKRSSIHDPLVIQQQNLQYNQQTMMPNDECAKWMLEPIVLCPLDPTAFLRKEFIEFKNTFQFRKMKETIEDDTGIKQARSTSVLSLKLLLKLVNYYDEMLTFTLLKEEFQRKKTICKGIIYSPWTGIPYLDIVRTSTGDDSFSSNIEISNYVNECFWPRILSCTIRLVHALRETNHAHKHSERQWTLELNLPNNNYFHNSIIKTPYNSIIICNQILAKLYSKIVDYIHSELRAAFELTHLFENYALSLSDSTDLRAISEVNSFNFFKSTIHYGPNFAFSVTLTHSTNQNQQDLSSNLGWTFDLRFTTINHKFLTTAHQILNGKLIQFLNRTHSLKQFIRLLHMTAIPISSIARLNCFNRPIVFVNQGSCTQPILTFVPYTEFRWRLIFGQMFALDIQICGPNLILIRDGAFSVQLNSVLPELSPIPRLKEFLSKYADDRGLTFEFTHITDRFRDRDFILPELQLPPPSFSMSTTTITNPPSNRPLISGNAQTPHLLHPVGTPGSSLNPLTPASVGPSSQSQQQANSPSQPIIAPSPGFMSTGSPLMMPTIGSPMTNNTPTTQLTAPSPMGITTQSPGTIYEMPYISPAPRPSGSSFPGSFLGPSPGTPANATITSVATPLNIRSDDIINKQTSTLHSYNRHLYTKQYPVYMSQQTFFRMLFTPDGQQWSKFESFLASSVLVKQFNRAVSESYDANNPTVRSLTNEQDTYRIEHLSLQIAFIFDINRGKYRIDFI